MHPALPPQTLGVAPPPQVFGAAQVPQSMTFPQPSPCCPQLTLRLVQVAGTHAALPPQTLGIPPPPQVSGAVHEPHSRRPPHPSATGPQFVPASAHVLGVQFDASEEPTVASPRRFDGPEPSTDWPPSLPPWPPTKSSPPLVPHAGRQSTHTKSAPRSQTRFFCTGRNYAIPPVARNRPVVLSLIWDALLLRKKAFRICVRNASPEEAGLARQRTAVNRRPDDPRVSRPWRRR
jgi:hypothetical protein